MLRTLSLSVLGLTCLAATSAGQSGLSPIPFAYRGRIAWPASLPAPTSVQHLVSGDFTADGQPDMAVIVNGMPYLFNSPDTHEAISVVAGASVTDIDRIPPVTGGTTSELALVGAVGLERAVWSKPTNTLGRSTLSGDSVWVNAKCVRVGFLDGDSFPDYVGINTAGNTLVVRYGNTGVQNTYALPEMVNDVAIVQWDDTTDREIALLDTYGVEVVTRTGVRVRRFARLASGSDAFTPYRKLIDLDGNGSAEEPEGRDRIAWIRRQATGGGQELVELSQRDGLVTASPNTPYTFSSGDLATNLVSNDSPSLDGSGQPLGKDFNDDLLINRMSQHAPLLLKNHGTLGPVYSFSPNPAFEEVVDDPTLESRASEAPGYASMPKPLYSDLSNDGIPDVCLAVLNQGNLWFQFWRGSLALQEWNQNQALVPSNGMYIQVLTYTPPAVGGNGLLQIQFKPSPVPTGPLPQALDTILWSRNSSGAYTCLDRRWFQVVGTTWHWPLSFTLPSPSTYNPCGSDQLWYEIHFATPTGSGSTFDLIAADTNYVGFVSPGKTTTTPLFDAGFSYDRCVVNTVPCGPLEGISCSGGQNEPTHSPGSITRRRVATATPPMPAPLPPSQTPAGTVNNP